MGRLKDTWKKKTKGKTDEERTFIGWVLITSIVFIGYVGFFSHDSLLRYAKAKIEIHQQNKQIEVYRSEIEQMNKTIKGLKDNPDSLEHYAREQFGFCEPGDEVYIDNK